MFFGGLEKVNVFLTKNLNQKKIFFVGEGVRVASKC